MKNQKVHGCFFIYPCTPDLKFIKKLRIKNFHWEVIYSLSSFNSDDFTSLCFPDSSISNGVRFRAIGPKLWWIHKKSRFFYSTFQAHKNS